MARPKSLGSTLLVALGAALLVGGAWLGFSQAQAREVARAWALPRAAPKEHGPLRGVTFGARAPSSVLRFG